PYTVVHPLADGSIMKVVLLYEATRIAPPSDITQRLRGVLESGKFGMPATRPGIEQNPSIIRSRRPGQLAIFTIDSTLRIVGSWLSSDPPAAEMRSIVSPRGNALPVFLETSVREATVEWNWETGEHCSVAVTCPIPQLIVRAIPMREGAMMHMVVLVELLHVRYTLATAQHDFRLSDREVQVLQLLFEGHRGSDIADALYLAESTVQDHIKHAIAKTGSSNRVEMTAKILGWSQRDRGSR
ncbi:MAG: helix-turn-helix transcriptional regulator, partial [Candidatus Eremiobacteraeota bacterium]|nr:helix-turn-helix transcriptional regulator [Candidatus Eremiobacteraeota bacterium]